MVRSLFIIIALFTIGFFFSRDGKGKPVLLVSAEADSGKSTVKIDTLNVRVQKVVLAANSVYYNCFMALEEKTGLYRFFVSEDLLNRFVDIESKMVYYFKNDLILGTGNYIKEFYRTEQTDTLVSYLETTKKYKINEAYVTDNSGIALLNYDLEISYIFKKLNQKVLSNCFYFILSEGAPLMPVVITPTVKKVTLICIDFTQDSLDNFFIYEAKTEPYSELKLYISKTDIVPLKKTKRIIENFGQVIKMQEPNIYSNGGSNTQVIIMDGKRYVISYAPHLNVADEWVNKVLEICNLTQRLKAKVLK